MAMTKLQAVNVMLRKLGNRPVNSLDVAHPRVPSAVAVLDRFTQELQATRWWFNVEYPTLVPQVGNARILLPGDCASADAVNRRPRVAVRGMYLYNLDDSTYEFTEALQVRLHRILPFDELPLLAAETVLTKAIVEWVGDNDGDDTKVRLAADARERAYSAMHAEHIRNSDRNLLERPSMRTAMTRIRGNSAAHWEY